MNGYLFFRWLEKVFEEERNENKKEVLPQTIGDRKGKDQDDEFLGG